MNYQVELVHPVEESLDAIPDSRFVEVDNALIALGLFPEMGRLYEPLYEASPAPEGLRVVYVRGYGIYYTVDHERETVYVRFIEDQRMDPRMRFTGRLQA